MISAGFFLLVVGMGCTNDHFGNTGRESQPVNPKQDDWLTTLNWKMKSLLETSHPVVHRIVYLLRFDIKIWVEKYDCWAE